VLVEPERTRYDVNFRVLRFPVRVHPFFWIATILLGSSALQDGGLLYLLIWVVGVFVSILVHELGHAIAFRRFWVESHIVLYMFGGLAVPWTAVQGRWRRIAVALAGPFAGFVLCGLVYGSNQLYPWARQNHLLAELYRVLFWINLIWGVVNLLPVFPLDGGQVSEEVCEGIWRRAGRKVALQISFVVAVLFCIYSLACEYERRNPGGPLAELPWYLRGLGIWSAILFAMLAVQSYQLLQQLARPSYYFEDAEDRPPWKR
jgi:Zn-dependent protease